MKKILLTLAMLLGLTAAQAAVGVSPRMLVPVWAASEAGIMPLELPTAALLDCFTGTVPEQGTVTSLYDDGELKIKFNSEVSINPAPTVYPKWLKDGVVVEELDDPYGNDMEDAVVSSTISVMKLYPDSFTPSGAGTYTLFIPDGYLFVNGQPAKGMELTWTIAGGESVETNSYSFKFADATDITGDDYSSGGIVGKNNPTFSLGGLKFDAHYVGSAPSNVAYKMLITTDGVSGTSTGFLRVPFQSVSSTQEIVITAPEGVTLTEVAFKTASQTAAATGTVTSETGSVSVSADQVVWKSTDPNGVNSVTTTWKGATRAKWEFGSVDVKCVGELGAKPEVMPSIEDCFDKTVPAWGNVSSFYDDTTLRIFFNALVTINPDSKNYMYWSHDGKVVKTLDDPYGNDVEELVKTETQSVIQLFEASYKPTEPGVYQLVIPDGYLMVNGKPATGGDIVFTIEGSVGGDDPVPAEFNLAGCINAELTFPQPGVDIDNEDGLSSVNISIAHAPAGFTVNPACTDRIYLNRDGAVVTSLAVNQDNPGAFPHYDLDGSGDTESWSGKFILAFAQMGIKDAGVYTVTIPEGFFKAGDATSTGYMFSYNILPPKEYVDAKYTVSPEADSTIEKLSSFTLTFTDETSVELVENYIKHIALVFNPKNAPMNKTDLENWSATVTGNAVTVTVTDTEEVLSQDGTLTVTASNVFKFGEKYASPITFTYNVKAQGGDTPGGETVTLESLVSETVPAQGVVEDSLYDDDTLRIKFKEKVTVNYELGQWPYWKKDGVTAYTYSMKWDFAWPTSSDMETTAFNIGSDSGYNPTENGVYELVIPDGFIVYNGKGVAGATFTWQIGATVAPVTASAADYFVRTTVPEGTVDSIYDDGELKVIFKENFTANYEGGVFPYWNKNGQKVFTYTGQWDFSPYNQYTETIFLGFDKDGFNPDGDGVYELVIPDDFLKFGGVGVKGMTLTWTIGKGGDEPSGPSAADYFVRTTVPEGTVDSIYDDGELKVIFKENFTANYEGGVFPYWNKNGQKVFTYTGQWDFSPYNQYTETIFLGFDKDGFNPDGDGVYELVIPDDFLKFGGVGVKGMTLTWTIGKGGGEEPSDKPSLKEYVDDVVPAQGEVSNLFPTDNELIIDFKSGAERNYDCAAWPQIRQNGNVVFDWASETWGVSVTNWGILQLHLQKPETTLAPGDYEIYIPEGFMTIDGKEASSLSLNYSLKGSALTFVKALTVSETGAPVFTITAEGAQTISYDKDNPPAFEFHPVNFTYGWTPKQTITCEGNVLTITATANLPIGDGEIVASAWMETSVTADGTGMGYFEETFPYNYTGKDFNISDVTYSIEPSTTGSLPSTSKALLTGYIRLSANTYKPFVTFPATPVYPELWFNGNKIAESNADLFGFTGTGTTTTNNKYYIYTKFPTDTQLPGGEYEIVYPAGMFLFNGVPNAAMTRKITKAAGTVDFAASVVEGSVSPAPDSVLEGFNQFSVTVKVPAAVAANTDCAENITLKRGEEVVATMDAYKLDAYSNPPYFMMFDEADGADHYVTLGFVFADSELTAEGEYTVNIPDTFFKTGVDTMGAYSVSYTVKAPVVPTGYDLTGHITDVYPAAGAVIESLEGTSMQFTLPSNLKANSACTEPITLTRGVSQSVVASILVTDTEEAKDSKAPYYSIMNGFADNAGDPLYETLNLCWADAAITEPGDYTVNIPNGFFLVGAEQTAALSFSYTIAEPPTVKSFASVFSKEYSSPLPGSDIENFSTVNIVFDSNIGNLTVNPDCAEKIVLTIDDKTKAEIGIADTKLATSGYPFYELNAASGSGNLVLKFAKDSEPMVAPAKYRVSIPEGFLKLGRDFLGAYTLTYTIKQPDVVADDYTLVTNMTTDGQYFIYADGLVMEPKCRMDEYYSSQAATLADGKLLADDANLFYITANGGAYNISAKKTDKYVYLTQWMAGDLGMDENAYTDKSEAGYLWNITIQEDGTALIQNMLHTEQYIAMQNGQFRSVNKAQLGSAKLPSLYTREVKSVIFSIEPSTNTKMETLESFTVTALNSETIKVGELAGNATFKFGSRSVAFTVKTEGNVATFTATAPVTGTGTFTAEFEPGFFEADGGFLSTTMGVTYEIGRIYLPGELYIDSYTPAPGMLKDGTDLKSVMFKVLTLKNVFSLNESRTAEPYLMFNGEVIKTLTYEDMTEAMNQYSANKFSEFTLVFSEKAITEPGEYKVVIPAGVFNVTGAPNTEVSWDYTMPVSAGGTLKSIVPAIGIVDPRVTTTGVGTIEATYSGDVTLNPASTASIALKKDGVTVYTITDEELFILRSYDEEADETTMTYIFGSGTVTENGLYTVSIPKGKLIVGEKELAAANYEYTVAATAETWTALPAPNSTVSELAEFTIQYLGMESIKLFDNFMDFAVITYQGVNVTSHWNCEVDGTTLKFTPELGYQPSGTGLFKVVLENIGSKLPAIEYALNVYEAKPTVTALAPVIIGSTPNTGIVSDFEYPEGLKTIVLTVKGKASVVEGATEDILLNKKYDDDSIETIAKVAPADIVINAGEETSTITLNFDFRKQLSGVHQLVIPNFVIAIDGLPAVGTTLAYNYEHDDALRLSELVTRIEPAEGIVDLAKYPNGLGMVTLYTKEELKPTTSNMWVHLVMYRDDAPFYTITAPTDNAVEYSSDMDEYTGEPYIRFYFGYDYEDSKQTEPGKYRIVIPDNDFLTVADQWVVSHGLELNYTIEEPVIVKPELAKPAISLPATVVTLDDLNEITLTLPAGSTAEIAESYTAELTAASRADVICSYTLRAEGNKVILSAVSPLTDLENGTYTLNISAGAFETADAVSAAYDYTVVYAGKSGVIGIEAAPSYTVHTIDGKCLMIDGTAEQLRDLAAGLYIVNGKKVLVRK